MNHPDNKTQSILEKIRSLLSKKGADKGFRFPLVKKQYAKRYRIIRGTRRFTRNLYKTIHN